MTALAPLYIKKAYKDEPSFRDAKVVFSVYEDDFKNTLSDDFATKLMLKGISKDDLSNLAVFVHSLHPILEIIIIIDEIYLHTCGLDRSYFYNKGVVSIIDNQVHTGEANHFVQLDLGLSGQSIRPVSP